jgi:hypothetical protein
LPSLDTPLGATAETNRDLEGDYYAFFAFDPEGIRVEVFCWPRA